MKKRRSTAGVIARLYTNSVVFEYLHRRNRGLGLAVDAPTRRGSRSQPHARPQHAGPRQTGASLVPGKRCASAPGDWRQALIGGQCLGP